MPKTARKLFSDDFREKIWAVFWRERNPKKFLTETEIVVLEKRLAAFYWLDQGRSLRETSEKSGLSKKVVVAVKHGFRKPIPRPARKEIPSKKDSDWPTRRRVFPSVVSDKLINDLRRSRHR